MKGVKIIFNGMSFYKYPESKSRSRRKYYYINNFVKGITTLHREIWKFYNGQIPIGFHIHHKDGNTDNNDISNLDCVSLKNHNQLHNSEIERKNLSIKTKELWKDRKKYKKICLFCKNEFETFWKNTAKFCSGNCTTNFRNKSKIDHVDKECVICKNKFKCNKYSPTTTCSRYCADKKATKTKELKNICLPMKDLASTLK